MRTCQVPRFSRPLVIGTFKEHPKVEDLTCAAMAHLF